MDDANSLLQESSNTNTKESTSKKVFSRRRFLAGTGTISAAAIGGCLGSGQGNPASTTSQTEPETVTFGTLTIPAVAEVLVAQDRGYFADRNIELEVKRIQSAPKATPQLASGDMDVAAGSIGASLFNAIAGGHDIRVVADQTQFWRGQAVVRILVRPEAAPNAESIYDLPEGLSVGLHGKGNVDSYSLARILTLNDMTWDDTEQVETLFSMMPTQMAEGKIDICAIPDPLGLQVMKQADPNLLGYSSMVAPRLQVGAYIFGGPFAENNPSTATRWLEAYLEGVRKYYEMGGSLNKDVAEIVSEKFGLPIEAIRSSIPSLPHKNGQLNAESVKNQQAYHACRGTVEETVPIDNVIDSSYLEAALDTVGRVDDNKATPSSETIEAWENKALAPYPPVGEIRTPDDFPPDSMC